MRKLPTPPKEELESLYLETGSTLSSLSKRYNTTHPTIRKWLKSYNIPLKGHLQSSREANRRDMTTVPSRNTLEFDYSNGDLKSLQKKYGIGQKTLYEWFDQNGIKARIPWVSREEAELLNKIILMDPEGEWESQNRTEIYPYFLDIFSKKRKLAVEYCGVYWHSEVSQGKGPDYHRNKMLMCRERGIRLITILDSDDQEKVLSLIRAKIGLNETLGARKLSIEKIDRKEAKRFEEKYHLSGSTGALVSYGLKREKELVSVMSMSRPRFSKKYEWEMARYTCSSGITIPGGAERLFKAFIRDHTPNSVVSYSDLRFGEGETYLRLGFNRLQDSGPNYWYWKTGKELKLYSRVKFQKYRLPSLLENFDPTKTEWENMRFNGWDRIWDCGNAVYVWKR